MIPNNLTREEAHDRARILTVSTYDVALDLTTSETLFGSTSTISFTCSEPGASTFVEIVAPIVSSVTLNGTALDVEQVFDGHRVTLPGLAAENTVTIVAECAYSHTGEGLHRFVDRVDKQVYLYSQFETYDAHRMYACFNQPDLKARFTFRVTAPEQWRVISNADVASRDGGRWVFEQTPVMSTYITALCAGPYAEVREEHDGIDLGWFCRESLAEHMDTDELFEITRQGFDFYHRNFDYRYPFGKYDQVFVPEFNAGAMENAGCVTYLEDYVFRSKVTDAKRERRAETILHEMAHMWFGDLVTMRWWDDLWLNESFATYASVLAQVSATRWTNGWTTFANAEKTWAYRQDQLPSTHPIVADATDMEAVKTNFDGITYAKGAAVLKQLVAWVGQEEFLAGLRVYFRRHEWGNTSLGDLLSVLEESSGRDLSSWALEWLETTGVNTLRPTFEVDDDGCFTSFTVLQEAAADHPTLRSHRIAVGIYDLVEGSLVRRDRIELDVVGPATDVPKLVGEQQPDLVLLNDDDLTFAKIRLDPRSLETVVHHIGSISDPLARALCWAAAWDMTRDAEMRARDFVTLVLSGVGVESDIGVVQSLLHKASTTILQFADPSTIPSLTRSVADKTLALLRAAEPGSDFQLAFALAFVSNATSAEHTDLVAGLLDGTVTLNGLAIDADLRWSLLQRLVVLGLRGEDAIAAELERDPTATGEKRAVQARASVPSAEAKAAAWAAVMESDELSNHLGIATMVGFWQPEHLALCEPYIERYFDEIGPIWQERSIDTAQTISELLYPTLVVAQSTVDRTDAYLRDASPNPALHRVLLESRDGVARALRARARDVP